MLASALYFAVQDCIRKAHKEAQATDARHRVRRLATDRTHRHHDQQHHAAGGQPPPQQQQQPKHEEQAGTAYEDVPLPVPATLEHRVVALAVAPQDMVLR